MDWSPPGSSVLYYLWNFLHFKSTESVMLSNHLILCCLLLLLPSIFPSIRVFSNKSAIHIRQPKCWRFNFSIHPSNEHSGLISFSTDWFDLLAVQRILKSLLQHHSSKVSILQCSAFFMVQLSHLYMTPGKTICVCMSEYIHSILTVNVNDFVHFSVRVFYKEKFWYLFLMNNTIFYLLSICW